MRCGCGVEWEMHSKIFNVVEEEVGEDQEWRVYLIDLGEAARSSSLIPRTERQTTFLQY